MRSRRLTDPWIQHPQLDAWLSFAAGIAFMLCVRFWIRDGFDAPEAAGILAGVAGTVLGMFGVVFGLLGNEGGRRVRSLLRKHAETVNRNWQSVLMLPGLALAASLIVVMFGNVSTCLSSALLGFSAAAVALSGLRMAWFVSMTFKLNEAEAREVKPEIDPNF